MPGSRRVRIAALALVAVAFAACTGATSVPTPSATPAPPLATASPSAAATAAPPTLTAAPSVATPEPPAPTAAPTAPATSAAAGSTGPTVAAKKVGSIGVVLVAANGMTVYQFGNDVKNSGKSACDAGCVVTWPALTIASGQKPVAGAGATGKLSTIKRSDGSAQVTYDGLPLYFFSGDKVPGDANGVYPGWSAVKP